MNREVASLIAFGADALGSCLRALHSTTTSDVGALRRVCTAWPSFLLDLDERGLGEAETPRVRYSPRQLERAERVCTLFVEMGQFTVPQRRCAVIKALRPQTTWADVARQVNAYELKPSARERLGQAERRVRLRDGGTRVERRTPVPAGRLMSWQECRGHHDQVLATFAYVVSAAEGVEIEAMTARPREVAS